MAKKRLSDVAEEIYKEVESSSIGGLTTLGFSMLIKNLIDFTLHWMANNDYLNKEKIENE